MFLSAPPLASRRESLDTSWHSAGSLCPYRLRKNFRESKKKTFRVLSRSDTESSLPSGVTPTLNTSSAICSVLTCATPSSRLVPIDAGSVTPASSTSVTSARVHSKNFTVLSADAVTNPEPSGSAAMPQTAPVRVRRASAERGAGVRVEKLERACFGSHHDVPPPGAKSTHSP